MHIQHAMGHRFPPPPDGRTYCDLKLSALHAHRRVGARSGLGGLQSWLKIEAFTAQKSNHLKACSSDILLFGELGIRRRRVHSPRIGGAIVAWICFHNAAIHVYRNTHKRITVKPVIRYTLIFACSTCRVRRQVSSVVCLESRDHLDVLDTGNMFGPAQLDYSPNTRVLPNLPHGHTMQL